MLRSNSHGFTQFLRRNLPGRLGNDHNVGIVSTYLRRSFVLLLALVVIKTAILAMLAPHIVHTHWRRLPQLTTWLDYGNLAVFGMLIAGTLFTLAGRLQNAPRVVVRSLNAGFAVAGLLFVFFSRSQVNNAYLYSVETGLLSPGHLWSYMQMDLFFAPPWLAAYLLIYPLAYWILVRKGREHWSLGLLGAMAAVYLALNLRDLAALGKELTVVNCLGIGGLVSFSLRRGPLGWTALLAPLALSAAVWTSLGRIEPAIANPDAYFTMLLAVSGALLVPAVLLTRGTAAEATLSHFLPFYFAAFLLLSNRNYPAAAGYNQLAVYAVTSPYNYLESTLIVAGLALVTALAHRWWSPRAVWCFDATAMLLILLSLVDFQVTKTMGVRLDWSVLTMGNDPAMLWKIVQPWVGGLIVVFALTGAAYFCSVACVRRVLALQSEARERFRGTSLAFVMVAFGTLALLAPRLVEQDKGQHAGLVNLILTSPLARETRVERMGHEQFITSARRLGMTHAAVDERAPVAGPPRDLNVLLIITESSFNRYLSLFGAPEETQPLLSRYRDRMELFPNFFSVFPNSLHARFAVLNGLYPVRQYISEVNPRIPCRSLPELLRDRGWATSLFYSSTRDYTRFGDWIGHRDWDVFYDASNMPGAGRHPRVAWGVSETATLDAMRARLLRHARQDERFFLTYIPAAPHQPFDSPLKEFKKFGESVGPITGNYVGRYLNQLLYMDWVIASLLDALEQNGQLDRTLVVITNDHGEQLGEDDGALGHGWNLDPVLCNTPLIILDPARRGPRVTTTVGSQVDVLPTVLNRLGLPLPAGELYQGLAMDDPRAQNPRHIYLDSNLQRAMVVGTNYFLMDDISRQAATHARHFGIRNDGARTIFDPLGDVGGFARQHDEFQTFQNSLLNFYGQYKDAVPVLRARPPAVGVLTSATPTPARAPVTTAP